MTLLLKVYHFILFSSIFIAACAVALAFETSLLLRLPLNHISFYSFIFGATLAQYNLHYLVKTTAAPGSQRLRWSLRNKDTHRVLFLIGCSLIIYSLFQFQLKHFYILIVLGGIAFLYSFPVIPFLSKKRIKDFGLLKILTLALLWTLVTVWFPASDSGAAAISYNLVFAMRFVFMFVLCLLFDIRDVQIDGREKINTVPVRIGAEGSYKVGFTCLLLFAVLAIVRALLFHNYMLLGAMLVSTLATWAVMQYSKKNHQDTVYLAGVDGMMLLQALLVWLVI